MDTNMWTKTMISKVKTRGVGTKGEVHWSGRRAMEAVKMHNMKKYQTDQNRRITKVKPSFSLSISLKIVFSIISTWLRNLCEARQK